MDWHNCCRDRCAGQSLALQSQNWYRSSFCGVRLILEAKLGWDLVRIHACSVVTAVLEAPKPFVLSRFGVVLRLPEPVPRVDDLDWPLFDPGRVVVVEHSEEKMTGDVMVLGPHQSAHCCLIDHPVEGSVEIHSGLTVVQIAGGCDCSDCCGPSLSQPTTPLRDLLKLPYQ